MGMDPEFLAEAVADPEGIRLVEELLALPTVISFDDTERCDAAADLHVTPHRGCVIR